MTTKLLRMGSLLALAIGAMVLIGYLYRTGPQARELVWSEKPTRTPVVPIVLDYHDDYAEPGRYAIMLWNNIMPTKHGARGTDLFVAGVLEERMPGESVVRVLPANGEPCGKFSIHETEGHAATSYECPDGTWEIHISMPGNIHDQLYIIAHEMGHVLGLDDDKSGSRIMRNNFEKTPEMLLVSDKDAAAVVKKYDVKKEEEDAEETPSGP